MSGHFVQQRRVEFRDTDLAGIVHFSVFFVWMEQLEHAALRHVGLSVHPQAIGTVVTWPRVSAQCEYLAPARFEDLIDASLTIERLGTKSVTYSMEFRRDATVLARGKLTAVCCRRAANGSLESTPIPVDVIEALQRLGTNGESAQ